MRSFLLLVAATLLCAIPGWGHGGAPRTGAISGGSGGSGAITSAETIPVTDCANPDGCIFIDLDSSNNVEQVLCAANGEAFDVCFPGASVSSGTAAPIGTVTCDEPVCFYSETDANILWINHELDDSSWRAIRTNSLVLTKEFYINGFDTTGDNNRCAHVTLGSTMTACGTTGDTSFTAPSTTGIILPRTPAIVEALRCRVVALAGDETTDSIAFTPLQRNGVDASIVTAGVTVSAGAADNSEHGGTLTNNNLTLTGGIVGLKVTATDGGGAAASITNLEAICSMVVSF